MLDADILRLTNDPKAALNQSQSSHTKQCAVYNAITAGNKLDFNFYLENMTAEELSCDRPSMGTVLSWALKVGSLDMVRSLLEREETFLSLYTSNLCLVLGSKLEESTKMKFLKTWLSKGHPKNQPLYHSHRDDIPLTVALREKHHEAFKQLCEADALKLAKKDLKYGFRPLSDADLNLIAAIEAHDYQGVCTACQGGANVQTLLTDPCGCPTPQIACTSRQEHDIYRIAAFNALHLAIVHSDERIAILLLENSAGPDVCYPVDTAVSSLGSLQGPSVLHEAAKFGKEDVIAHVLEKGIVNVDCMDAVGSTPLAIASKYCQIGCMRKLVQYGASVDQEDDDKLTPLERVGKNRNDAGALIIEAAMSLINAGASWRKPARPRCLLDIVCEQRMNHPLATAYIELAEHLMKYSEDLCQGLFNYVVHHKEFSLAEAFIRNGVWVPILDVFAAMRSLWPDNDDCSRARIWCAVATALDLDEFQETLLHEYIDMAETELLGGEEVRMRTMKAWDRFKMVNGAPLLLQLVKNFGTGPEYLKRIRWLSRDDSWARYDTGRSLTPKAFTKEYVQRLMGANTL